MRCAKCKHSWKAEPPENIEVVASPLPETVPIPDAIAPIPEGSNLPVVTRKPFSFPYWQGVWAGLAVILLIALVWLIFDRQHIARHWKSMEPFYNAIGLYIYYPGDGLEFESVRSELKYDAGVTKLVLDGKVKNKTKNNQIVPNIVAQALGSDGQVIQSWQIDAPKATLAPDEEADFTSSINTPKGTVVNVNLNFAEIKDDK